MLNSSLSVPMGIPILLRYTLVLAAAAKLMHTTLLAPATTTRHAPW